MSDRVVVIGNPTSVFVQAPVRYWRGLGVDALILTTQWTGAATVDGDLPVVNAEALTPAWVHRAADGLVPFLGGLDAMSLAHDPGRVRHALRTWGDAAVAPSLAPPVRDAFVIAAAVAALEPACVLGHEAFAYGLAASICQAPRRALFAWGADVLHYAAMSDAAGALVRGALHGVHYVLTNTATVQEALHERFDLPTERIALVSYGVDRDRFRRASGERAARIRAANGIAPDARVVTNVRRFRPHWGAAVAWPAMLAAAERRPDVHLLVLGGSTSDRDLRPAIEEARGRGLQARVTAIHGIAELDTVADLMAITDVALSLVDSLEPVSWSVLQAAACGAGLVICDQPTYRAECARGLGATLVAPRDVEAATAAVLTLLDDESLCARASSDRYLAEHHDQHAQMTRLLRIVAGSAAADRLLGETV